jgi:hypothetical protein
MNAIIDELGSNAGKLWRTLYSNGTSLTQTKLQKNTDLSEESFFKAVGWLARENKINKIGVVYRLGETNLTSVIGSNAGKIWHFLDAQKEADVTTIMQRTKIDEQNVHAAIGWLARENKIDAQTGKNNHLVFRLK